VSPRVREDSVHPRLQSGVFGRPLNFTVRFHLMAFWPLRKINAYVFRAGYTLNAQNPLWWPGRVPTAWGMILVCLWQSLLVIGVLFAICGALRLKLGRTFAFSLIASVVISLAVLNFNALLAKHQWRQLTSHIRGHSETDWTFVGVWLFLCAAGLWALLAWFLPPVIDYSR
jgi:hypothetical protein